MKIEFFISWYSGVAMERFAFYNRAFGNFSWAYWIMVTCNVFIPQLFWFKFFRTNTIAMVVICIFVNIGMWFERFVITITSLCRDYLPSSWHYFHPTEVDIMMFIGTSETNESTCTQTASKPEYRAVLDPLVAFMSNTMCYHEHCINILRS